MSLLLNTGAMHYRESANDAWKPLIIKADADLMVLADAYSSSTTYQLGEYCRRDGKLYRCITAITTAEAWNSSHWLETTIGAELEALNNAVTKGDTRRFLFIGDSYDVVTGTRWSTIVSNALGLTDSVAVAQGGYGFVTNNNKTWLSLLQNQTIENENTITDIVICGGTNDAWGTQSNIPSAMSTFNEYIKGRFTGLKNVWLGFIGNTRTTDSTVLKNFRTALAWYVDSSKSLGWHYLHGVENTLLYAPFMQEIQSGDFNHPTAIGVAAVASNIIQCLNSGSCENYHYVEDISFSSNTTLFASKSFVITEGLSKNIVTIAMGDVSLTNTSALSGNVVLGTCGSFKNMIKPNLLMSVYVTSGTNKFMGILYFGDFDTVRLIIPGGVSISANTGITLHGFRMIFDMFT